MASLFVSTSSLGLSNTTTSNVNVNATATTTGTTDALGRDDIILPSDQGFVRSLLECPVCSEYMTGRVRLCGAGHSMCDYCFANLLGTQRPCPLCRKPLSSISARNFFLENLAALCKFKCKFSERGCDEEVEGFLLDIHTKQCNFRDFKCQLFGIQEICNQNSLRYKDFIDHLTHDHEIPVVENGSWIDKTFRLEDGLIQPSLVLVKFEETLIFFHTTPLANRYPYIQFQSSHEHMHTRWLLKLDEESASKYSIDTKITEQLQFEILTKYAPEEEETEEVAIPEIFERNSVMRGILETALSFTQEYQPLDLRVCRGNLAPLSMYPRDRHRFTKEGENSLFGLSLRNGATKMTWKEKVTIKKIMQ